jgi:copper resistance protein B
MAIPLGRVLRGYPVRADRGLSLPLGGSVAHVDQAQLDHGQLDHGQLDHGQLDHGQLDPRLLDGRQRRACIAGVMAGTHRHAVGIAEAGAPIVAEPG